MSDSPHAPGRDGTNRGPGLGPAGGGGQKPASAGPPRCSVPAAREEETAGRTGRSGATPRRRTPGGRQLRAPPLPGPMAAPPAAPPQPRAALLPMLLLLAALLPAAAGRQHPGTGESIPRVGPHLSPPRVSVAPQPGRVLAVP